MPRASGALESPIAAAASSIRAGTLRYRRDIDGLRGIAILLVLAYHFKLPALKDALIFKANLYFDREIGNYFGANARTLPLLHTWSLSIEWQFYLLFPLFYLTIQNRDARRTMDRLRPP